MPFKHNAAIRDKFPKAKYRVSNWREYNEALRQRGSAMVWFDLDAVSGWRAAPTGKRGGQRRYPDLAIEIWLTLPVVFNLPLRQVQGFARSLLNLLDLDLPVPDFSTLCRRGTSLNITPDSRPNAGSITLIVDSTGLQVQSGRDWMQEKHGPHKSRKTWRKLHIGYDPEAGEIVAAVLTEEHVGDPSALPELLAQVADPVTRFFADGAYDGGPTADKIRAALRPDVELIIPPPKDAVMGDCAVRNAHIERIAEKGRMAWQRETGYGECNRRT